MQSIYNVEGNSLLEKYSQQVVTSQLTRRATTAVIDKDICTKNAIELKSYFVSSLASRLLPDIEDTVSWLEGFADNAGSADALSCATSAVQGPNEVIKTLRTMAYLLKEVQEYAQLEAGICYDMPEALDINEVVRSAMANITKEAGPDGIGLVLEPSSDPMHVLGYPAKLNQCFSNLIRYAYLRLHADRIIKISTDRLSEFEILISIRYAGEKLSDTEIQQSLTANNLVEHIIAIGAGHQKTALPTAYALIDLHSGKIDIRNRANGDVEIRVIFPSHEVSSNSFNRDETQPVLVSS